MGQKWGIVCVEGMRESDKYSLIQVMKKEPPFFAIDDIPEFHDPFSPLSLYLAKKIRSVTKDTAYSSWSFHLQESLLKEIAYEFQQKFPKYLLSCTAVKQIWEKQFFLIQELTKHPDTFLPDGQLNIETLLRENIQNFYRFFSPYSYHPFYQAQHLAVKIAEIAASLEGRKIEVDKLSRKVWLNIRCLIADSKNGTAKKIEEEIDGEDIPLISSILPKILQSPKISYKDLYESLIPYYEPEEEKLSSFCSLGEMIYAFVNVNKLDPDYSLAQKIIEKHFEQGIPIPFDTGDRIDHFVKIIWYQKTFDSEVSIFERWLLRFGLTMSIEEIVDQSQKQLPFIATNRADLVEFFRENQESNPKNNKRKTECLRHIQQTSLVC